MLHDFNLHVVSWRYLDYLHFLSLNPKFDISLPMLKPFTCSIPCTDSIFYPVYIVDRIPMT